MKKAVLIVLGVIIACVYLTFTFFYNPMITGKLSEVKKVEIIYNEKKMIFTEDKNDIEIKDVIDALNIVNTRSMMFTDEYPQSDNKYSIMIYYKNGTSDELFEAGGYTVRCFEKLRVKGWTRGYSTEILNVLAKMSS